LDDKQQNQLWEIAGRYLGEEPMHGLPHVRRAYRNFRILPRRLLPLGTYDALETSIILHDLGRAATGQEDHATKSAYILNTVLFPGELSWVEHQGWVHRAVSAHSTGHGHEVRDEADMVLAHLCIFDHMDCLGPIGIHRLTLYWSGGQPYKIPWIPPGLDVEARRDLASHLNGYLREPAQITREMMPMRESSLLEALTFYCCATDHIVAPVKRLIEGEDLERRISDSVAFTRSYVETLLFDLLAV